MKTAIAPSIMPASTAPAPSDVQAAVDHAGVGELDLPDLGRASCPAATSALSTRPDAHAARFGTIASTIAA